MDLRAALEPLLDTACLLDAVPELSLARELEGSQYHHLNTLDHIIEVVRGVECELEEGRVGARVGEDRVGGLRLAALLHDVAKPVTRGELEGRVLFVSHDSLGARMVRRIGRRLGLSAEETDRTSTLTALHLKIGFMGNPSTDYPSEYLPAPPDPSAKSSLSSVGPTASQPRARASSPSTCGATRSFAPGSCASAATLVPTPSPTMMHWKESPPPVRTPTSVTQRAASGSSQPEEQGESRTQQPDKLKC